MGTAGINAAKIIFFGFSVIAGTISTVVIYFIIRYFIGLRFKNLKNKPHSGVAFFWLLIFTIPASAWSFLDMINKTQPPDWLVAVYTIIGILPTCIILYFRMKRAIREL